MVSQSLTHTIMLTSITITSTASLSTSTNPRPKKRQNHGMQRSGGGAVFEEIKVNSRRPLIPDVIARCGSHLIQLNRVSADLNRTPFCVELNSNRHSNLIT